MSIVGVGTHVRYELFYTWIEDVHARMCDATGEADPAYMLFVGEGSAYAYTKCPILKASGGCYEIDPHRLPGYVDTEDTPIYCSPQVDMSTTSVAELYRTDDVACPEHAIEDVTIGSIAEHIVARNMQMVTLDLDKDIKFMRLFVDAALPGRDTSVLMSFVNYAASAAGHGLVVYHGVPMQRHTALEARSEMMRCNPDAYDSYKHRLLGSMLKSLIDNSRSKHEMEHLVSGMVYEILFDSVVNCVGVLWCFSDGLWQECASEGYVWKFLTNDFVEYLQSKGADDIAHYMMSSNTRTRVMKDVKLRLQDDNFFRLLDSKRHVVRMVNGVYNTDTETLLGPVPSDYVSVMSGVPYQVFDPMSHDVEVLMSILGTIFPHPEVLDFFMLSCSTFLEGYNNPKVFYIWWGEGNNAKSLVQTLVMKTFGDYCSTAPTSLVTGQRSNASNATPELCHVEKRLVVFLQEPNPDETIKAGKMKEMTGNDSMYVRQLFKSGKTITFKAKIVIVCNNVIEIPGMDAAIRRRIVVLPFVSTFLSAAEYRARCLKGTLSSESRIIDPSIERDLLSCKSAFMYMLCKRYAEFRDAGFSLDIPQSIRDATEEYVTKNNHQLTFIRTFVHCLEGSRVAATEVYEMFKEWFRRSYPGKRVQDFERFVKELCEEGFRDDGKGVINDVYVSYTGELGN